MPGRSHRTAGLGGRAARRRSLLDHFAGAWSELARALAADVSHREEDLRAAERRARIIVEAAAFLRCCDDSGVLAGAEVRALDRRLHPAGAWPRLIETWDQRRGPGLFEAEASDGGSGCRVADALAGLPDLPATRQVGALLMPQRSGGQEGRMAAHDLGRLHERLLGMRLVRGRAGLRVERSRQARKAAGVFYTPPCVVGYIVESSIESWHAAKDGGPGARPPVIVDPACGCGAFLSATLKRRAAAGARDGRPGDPLIGLQSLYGVDLDAEAVLAARRTLWIEARLLSAPRQGGAPGDGDVSDLLRRRIVCCDALAGPALDGLMGRADVVLGNPPYRRELGAKALFDRLAGTDLGRRWRTAHMDLHQYFVHRGLELLRPGGVLSFILSAYWTAGRSGRRLVAALREAARVEEVFLLDDIRVFREVAGRHLIVRVRKTPGPGTTLVKRPGAGAGCDLGEVLSEQVPLVRYVKGPNQLFRGGRLDLEPPGDEELERLDGLPTLGRLGRVRQGIVENPAQVTRRMNERHGGRWRVGEGVFALSDDELQSLELSSAERNLIRPYHDLCDVGRFYLADRPSQWLIYSTARTCPDLARCPALRRHLERFRPLLEARREVRRGVRAWWHLHWPRDEAVWRASKVIALQMARRPSFVSAERPVYVPFSVNVFVPGPERREHVRYFAAVLGSRLLEAWFRRHAKRRGVGLEINGGLLAQAPLRPIDFADPRERQVHDRLVELAGAVTRAEPAPREDPRSLEPLAEIDRLMDDLYGVSGGAANRA